MRVRLHHATAPVPGAIAIFQLIGDSAEMLRQLTGVHDWPLQRLRLVKFDDIDEGLAVRLTDNVAQLMPHGGPRVLQRLTARLVELGAELLPPQHLDRVSPQHMYPEAQDAFEALALTAVAGASSPLAIDLLLDQPRRWREHDRLNVELTDEDHQRSSRLNRLIDPPTVVLVGRPNVGKSTLTNALFGRSLSIAYDMPGTTRDYTVGQVELAGLTLRWYDTPGLRETDDVVERRAIETSRRLMDRAELLIAMTDPSSDWPRLPREPDVRVLNKIDLSDEAPPPRDNAAVTLATSADAVLRISAQSGAGVADFVAIVRDRLVPPTDRQHQGVWIFDQLLLQQKTSLSS